MSRWVQCDECEILAPEEMAYGSKVAEHWIHLGEEDLDACSPECAESLSYRLGIEGEDAQAGH